jgi:hypothetical protein
MFYFSFFFKFCSIENLPKFYIKLTKLVEIKIDKIKKSKFPKFPCHKMAKFHKEKKKKTDLEGAFNP